MLPVPDDAEVSPQQARVALLRRLIAEVEGELARARSRGQGRAVADLAEAMDLAGRAAQVAEVFCEQRRLRILDEHGEVLWAPGGPSINDT